MKSCGQGRLHRDLDEHHRQCNQISQPGSLDAFQVSTRGPLKWQIPLIQARETCIGGEPVESTLTAAMNAIVCPMGWEVEGYWTGLLVTES